MEHTKPHLSELSRAIIELRQVHGMSRPDLAKHFGIQNRTVMRWENGNTIPQPTFLREMIAMSEPKYRHIFEETLGKTFGQISLEHAIDKPSPAVRSEWMSKPSEHSDDIHYAIQQRLRALYLKSKNGDERSAQKMAALLAHVLSVSE